MLTEAEISRYHEAGYVVPTGFRLEPQRLESLQMGCVSYSRAYFPEGEIS